MKDDKAFKELKDFMEKRFDEVSRDHKRFPSFEQQIRDELIKTRRLLTEILKSLITKQ